MDEVSYPAVVDGRHRLFELSIDMLCVVGFDGNFKQINSAWTRTLAWSESEMLSRPWLDFVHPGDREIMVQAERAIFDGAPAINFENRYACKDGSYRWMSWSANPHPDEGEIYAVVRDVTERKQAEVALYASESRFRRLLASLQVAVYTCDSDGLITFYNEQAAKLWGRSPALDQERFCASPRTFSLDGSAMRPDQTPMARCLQRRRTITGHEIIIERLDGSTVFVEPHSEPSFGADGELTGTVNVLIDITERKKAFAREAARSRSMTLVATGALLPAVLESIVHGVEAHDPDALCSVMLLDQAGAHLLLGAAPSLPGFFNNATHGLAIGPTAAACGRAAFLRSRVVVENIQTDPHCESVREVAANAGLGSCWSEPILSTTGRVLGTFAVYHRGPCEPSEEDINTIAGAVQIAAIAIERKQVEAAESASQAKTNFLSRMSHELRTPLNAILGFSQLLSLDAEKLLSLTQREHVQHISHAGSHLLSLIDDLLDISSIEAELVKIHLGGVDALQTVRDVVANFSVQSAQAQIDISVEDPPSGFGLVHADHTRLGQVIMNLLSNAIKYGKPGGAVVVKFALAGQRCQIVVSDNGMGMSAQQLEGLFQPFNRLGREFTSIEGTGIGLVIAMRLVDLMGGALRAHSQPGLGSEFLLELAAAEPGAHACGTSNPMPIQPTAHIDVRGRVLYIEDDEVNRLLMENYLAMRPGVTLTLAADGKSGIEHAGKEEYDVIFIDMMMPDLSGTQVLQAIRAQDSLHRTPCIVVSANAMPQEIADAMAAGFDGYITKPVSFSILLAEVDRLLTR